MKLDIKLSRNDSGISGASLASMIDIIFLLIIFFIVTASFDNAQNDSSVTLPIVSKQAPVKDLPGNRLILNVLENGEVRIGFDSIIAGKLTSDLPHLLLKHKVNSQTTVIINGDKNTRHRLIAQVMGILAGRGLKKVQINALIENHNTAETAGVIK